MLTLLLVASPIDYRRAGREDRRRRSRSASNESQSDDIDLELGMQRGADEGRSIARIRAGARVPRDTRRRASRGQRACGATRLAERCVTCAVIFRLLPGYFLGAYFKTRRGDRGRIARRCYSYVTRDVVLISRRLARVLTDDGQR